jgi:hypothetical protein
MRRLIAIGILVAVASVTAACTSSSPSPGSTTSNHAGGGTGSNQTATVCANLRTVLAKDIGPVGTALGAAVGDGIAHNSTAQAKAQGTATTALRKLGTDIASTAAAGNDPAVRAAAATTSKNLSTLLSDPTFFANIKSLDDIASATQKLQSAAAPIATACQGS